MSSWYQAYSNILPNTEIFVDLDLEYISEKKDEIWKMDIKIWSNEIRASEENWFMKWSSWTGRKLEHASKDYVELEICENLAA